MNITIYCLQLHRTSLPAPPDHLKNPLISVDSNKVIPLACCRMSFERLVGTHKFPQLL